MRIFVLSVFSFLILVQSAYAAPPPPPPPPVVKLNDITIDSFLEDYQNPEKALAKGDVCKLISGVVVTTDDLDRAVKVLEAVFNVARYETKNDDEFWLTNCAIIALGVFEAYKKNGEYNTKVTDFERAIVAPFLIDSLYDERTNRRISALQTVGKYKTVMPDAASQIIEAAEKGFHARNIFKVMNGLGAANDEKFLEVMLAQAAAGHDYIILELAAEREERLIPIVVKLINDNIQLVKQKREEVKEKEERNPDVLPSLPFHDSIGYEKSREEKIIITASRALRSLLIVNKEVVDALVYAVINTNFEHNEPYYALQTLVGTNASQFIDADTVTLLIEYADQDNVNSLGALGLFVDVDERIFPYLSSRLINFVQSDSSFELSRPIVIALLDAEIRDKHVVPFYLTILEKYSEGSEVPETVYEISSAMAVFRGDLGEEKERVVQYFLDLSDDQEWKTQHVEWFFQKHRDEKAIPLLLTMLEQEKTLPHGILMALDNNNITYEELLPSLIKSAQNGNKYVMFKYHDERAKGAIPVLLDLLSVEEKKSEEERDSRYVVEILHALFKINPNDKRVRKAIRKAQNSIDVIIRKGVSDVIAGQDPFPPVP